MYSIAICKKNPYQKRIYLQPSIFPRACLMPSVLRVNGQPYHWTHTESSPRYSRDSSIVHSGVRNTGFDQRVSNDDGKYTRLYRADASAREGDNRGYSL